MMLLRRSCLASGRPNGVGNGMSGIADGDGFGVGAHGTFGAGDGIEHGDNNGGGRLAIEMDTTDFGDPWTYTTISFMYLAQEVLNKESDA